MEESNSPDSVPAVCRNCGADLSGKFCALCGEKRFVPGENSIRHFAGDFVREVTLLDSKFLGTFKLMLVRPGAMSYQYLNGRRVPFIKPLSLFFLANLIYFLFPPFSSLNSPLYNQMYQLPHSSIAERMVKQELKETKTSIKTFEVAYNQHSTNMAKMVLFLMVLYFSVPLALINYSKKLFYYDHLMICLELFSLIVLAVFVAIPWALHLIVWLTSLGGGNISFILNDSVTSWILVVALFYLLFRIEREAYIRSVFSSLGRAAFLVAFFMVVLQTYRASLFFITFWTM